MSRKTGFVGNVDVKGLDCVPVAYEKTVVLLKRQIKLEKSVARIYSFKGDNAGR